MRNRCRQESRLFQKPVAVKPGKPTGLLQSALERPVCAVTVNGRLNASDAHSCSRPDWGT
jgi:hypothetical protein